MIEIIVALLCVFLLVAISTLTFCRRANHSNVAANAQLGISEHQMGLPGRFADVAFPGRYLLCKQGGDWLHIALPVATSDEPEGVAIDSPGEGYPSTVRLLGAHKGTQTMIANGAIETGSDIYSTGDGTGQVMPEPNEAGTFWLVGRLVGVASVNQGDYLEVEACKPIKVVIVAAMTSAQIGGAPTEANYNALQADMGSLAAALAHPAMVKVI
jgi:hypothetical protein